MTNEILFARQTENSLYPQNQMWHRWTILINCFFVIFQSSIQLYECFYFLHSIFIAIKSNQRKRKKNQNNTKHIEDC